MSDYEMQGMKFPVRMKFTIEKVRVSRLAAARRLVRHLVRGNWRGVKAAAAVVRTGMDNPYRGVVVNAGV